jgi:hypothetical protein
MGSKLLVLNAVTILMKNYTGGTPVLSRTKHKLAHWQSQAFTV